MAQTIPQRESLTACAILPASGLEHIWQKPQAHGVHRRPELGALTIEPNQAYALHGWRLDGTGTEKTLSVTMNRHRVVEADVKPERKQR